MPRPSLRDSLFLLAILAHIVVSGCGGGGPASDGSLSSGRGPGLSTASVSETGWIDPGAVTAAVVSPDSDEPEPTPAPAGTPAPRVSSLQRMERWESVLDEYESGEGRLWTAYWCLDPGCSHWLPNAAEEVLPRGWGEFRPEPRVVSRQGVEAVYGWKVLTDGAGRKLAGRTLGGVLDSFAFGVGRQREIGSWTAVAGIQVGSGWERPVLGVWRGAMVGTEGDRFLVGDAALEAHGSHLSARFTDVVEERPRPSAVVVRTQRIVFPRVHLHAEGMFLAEERGGARLEGSFYGDGSEAGGVFEADEILGAFGVKREEAR